MRGSLFQEKGGGTGGEEEEEEEDEGGLREKRWRLVGGGRGEVEKEAGEGE